MLLKQLNGSRLSLNLNNSVIAVGLPAWRAWYVLDSCMCWSCFQNDCHAP